MILELTNIAKQFSDIQLLKNVNFTVAKQEIVGIVGENGAGKSTILKMINSLISQDSGRITYNNVSISDYTEKELRQYRKAVVYVFQNANLLENKTVQYHLELIDKLNDQKPNQNKIAEVLSYVNITHLRKRKCGLLSGGEKQKVAIAMALLQNPTILLCDEISSALDAKSEQDIFHLLKRLNEDHQIAIIMVSHNLSLVKSMCDKIVLLKEGTTQILQNKKQPLANIKNDYYQLVEEYFNG